MVFGNDITGTVVAVSLASCSTKPRISPQLLARSDSEALLPDVVRGYIQHLINSLSAIPEGVRAI